MRFDSHPSWRPKRRGLPALLLLLGIAIACDDAGPGALRFGPDMELVTRDAHLPPSGGTEADAAAPSEEDEGLPEGGADAPVAEDGPPAPVDAALDGPAPLTDGSAAPDAAPPLPDTAVPPTPDAASDAAPVEPDVPAQPADAATLEDDLGVVPMADARLQPMPDAASDAAGSADVQLPDALPTPLDAAAPSADLGPPCAPELLNACGDCGELPAETCNGLDDDCDGETDEGDADADGMNDCGELAAGLDPANPGDNTGDPDHDGVSNPDEVLAGTVAVPVLSLVAAPPEPGDDPEVFDVIVVLNQPRVELRPILVEIYIEYLGRIVFEEAFLGEAALAADKTIFWHPIEPDRLRFTLTAPNVVPIRPGELARLRFRRLGTGESRLFFDTLAIQLAPIESQNAATYGVGHPAEPLILPGVPLLISEVDYDQISSDLNEFVELLNPNPFPIALGGLALEVRNGSNGQLIGSTPLDGTDAFLGPGQRLVYGMAPVLAALPAGALSLLQAVNLPNAAGSVRIVDTQTQPALVLDVLGWEGARLDLGLCEGAPSVEDPNNVASRAVGRCPNSPDTDDNAGDFVLQVSSPGAPNVCP